MMLWSVWFAGNTWRLVQGSCHVVFRDTRPGDSAARTHKGHSHFRVLFDCGEIYFSSFIFHFANSWWMMWHDPHFSELHFKNFLVIVAFKLIQTLRKSKFILSRQPNKNFFSVWLVGDFFESHVWENPLPNGVLEGGDAFLVLVYHCLAAATSWNWWDFFPWHLWTAERWGGRRQPGQGWSFPCYLQVSFLVTTGESRWLCSGV